MIDKKVGRNEKKAETYKAVSSSDKFLPKIFITFIFFSLLININTISGFNFDTNSKNNLGTFKQGDCISLFQTCQDCNYVNITSIIYPDGTVNFTQELMTKKGIDYNYTFCDTMTIGEYKYTTHGDKGGADATEVLDFRITSSGEGSVENIVFIVSMLVFLFSINLLGFFKRNATITILGGIGLTFLGLYMIQYGIIIFRNDFTLAVSYLTLFWGAGSALWASVEQLELF
jgi:hypothetical protein